MVDRDDEPEPDGSGDFSVSPWDKHGAASLTASGSGRRAALEAGLQAVLALAVPTPSAVVDVRAVPIRGTGADLSALFADLAADLLAQIDAFGAGLADVAVDGVVQGDAGQYEAWGYAFGPLGAAVHDTASVQVEAVEVSIAGQEPGMPVQLRATLRRGTKGGGGGRVGDERGTEEKN